MTRPKLILGVVFATCAAIGFIVAVLIKPQPTPTTPPITQESNPHSILFIGVPEFSSKEVQLESAWLATRDIYEGDEKTTVHITLIAIYPVSDSMVTSAELAEYSKKHEALRFDPNNLQTLTDLPPFSQGKAAWEGASVVILDEIFLNSAITLNNPGITTQIATPSDDLFIKPWIDPATAYNQQYGILTNFCHHPDNFFQYRTMAEPLLNLYDNHIRSELSANELHTIWQLIVNLGNVEITCDIFPEP